MEIDISKVYGDLMYVAGHVGRREYSGNLFAERDRDRIIVYDFVLLDVGNYGYTQIKPELMLPLLERSDIGKLKGWCHKHPLGDGIPGPHNWSGTDERNIQETPLGSLPELVKWSFSIVLTPRGWVGRVDNYVTGKTLHCPVVYFRPETAAKAQELAPKDLKTVDFQALKTRFDYCRYNQLYFGDDGNFYSLTPEEVETLRGEGELVQDPVSERPSTELDLDLMQELEEDALGELEELDDNWDLLREDWGRERLCGDLD